MLPAMPLQRLLGRRVYDCNGAALGTLERAFFGGTAHLFRWRMPGSAREALSSPSPDAPFSVLPESNTAKAISQPMKKQRSTSTTALRCRPATLARSR